MRTGAPTPRPETFGPPGQAWGSDTAPGAGRSPWPNARGLIESGGREVAAPFPLPPSAAVQRQTPPALPGEERPGGGGGLDPGAVALEVLVHVALPDLRVRVNPALGLVALPSWFWAEGYAGQSFGGGRTVEIPAEVGPEVPVEVVPAEDGRRRSRSFTVDVRVWGSRYDWDFGDGGTASGTLGRAYPAESEVRHTYRHSSLPFSGGFPVRLTVEYAAEYRVNGAGPFGLPRLRRTYETAHRVQEIQAVLLAR